MDQVLEQQIVWTVNVETTVNYLVVGKFNYFLLLSAQFLYPVAVAKSTSHIHPPAIPKS